MLHFSPIDFVLQILEEKIILLLLQYMFFVPVIGQRQMLTIMIRTLFIAITVL